MTNGSLGVSYEACSGGWAGEHSKGAPEAGSRVILLEQLHRCSVQEDVKQAGDRCEMCKTFTRQEMKDWARTMAMNRRGLQET